MSSRSRSRSRSRDRSRRSDSQSSSSYRSGSHDCSRELVKELQRINHPLPCRFTESYRGKVDRLRHELDGSMGREHSTQKQINRIDDDVKALTIASTERMDNHYKELENLTSDQNKLKKQLDEIELIDADTIHGVNVRINALREDCDGQAKLIKRLLLKVGETANDNTDSQSNSTGTGLGRLVSDAIEEEHKAKTCQCDDAIGTLQAESNADSRRITGVEKQTSMALEQIIALKADIESQRKVIDSLQGCMAEIKEVLTKQTQFNSSITEDWQKTNHSHHAHMAYTESTYASMKDDLATQRKLIDPLQASLETLKDQFDLFASLNRASALAFVQLSTKHNGHVTFKPVPNRTPFDATMSSSSSSSSSSLSSSPSM